MAGSEREPPALPRHFFLNEAHELASVTPEGGGRFPDFVPINWKEKSLILRASFDHAAYYSVRAPDPSITAHRFLLTSPAPLTKRSRSAQAQATDGLMAFMPSFGGRQAHLFTKLGMDLLSVDDEGTATVHVATARLPQLQSKLSDLEHANAREKVRWINIGEFQPVLWTKRIDQAWLDSLRTDELTDAHLRFHPVLPRNEVQEVLEAMFKALARGEQLVRAGRDFSGRYWCIAKLRKHSLRQFAEMFPSLQSMHPRLSTPVAAVTGRSPGAHARSPRSVDLSQLPTIGMFDTGVPESHSILNPYIRNRYIDPALASELAPRGNHGSQVASALIFGQVVLDDQSQPLEPPSPSCRVFDMLGGWTYKDAEVPDELMDRAIDGVIATAPDVRVFNLSLGGPRLDILLPKEREEKLRYLQDLDNQAFARDILLVYSAGNSPPGVKPNSAYPRHIDDPAWQLGVLARNFNGLVVGAYVDPTSPRGIVKRVGGPSPFTCVGPGQLDSPVPSFSAPGGDCKDDYTQAYGSGINTLNASGLWEWEDCIGTSFAAPLVAREAAFAFQELARFCPDGRPFAATVRAWLTLVACRTPLRGMHEKLALRSLGNGFPSAERIRTAKLDRAVFVWQTVLDAPGTTSRVGIPVPRTWLAGAATPRLRLVVAWLTPVNSALTETWSCRKVAAQLKTSTVPGVQALRTGAGTVGAYPVSDRTFDISAARLAQVGQTPDDDMWCLDVTYEDLGPPPAGMEFATQQRVGVAIELWDAGEAPVSPQAAIQALAIPPMTRLSVLHAPIQVPVTIR